MRPVFTKSDNLENAIVDLDDFYDETKDCLKHLYFLKKEYPKFKVTLFAIPGRSSKLLLKEVSRNDWIKLAIHGFLHDPPNECAVWSDTIRSNTIKMCEEWGCFVKGFKAPGWHYNSSTLTFLRDRGYWIADLEEHREMWPEGLKVYSTEHPWIVHGHCWNLNNPDPRYNNGIEQIIKNGVPWNKETNFYFISEVI